MRQLFLASPLIHADGMPLVFASRWRCRMPLPERVATTDLFHDVAKLAVGAGVSFYMLGGAPEALQKAVANVRKLYPGLILVGSRHGYFRPQPRAAHPGRRHQDGGRLFDFLSGERSRAPGWMQAAGLEWLYRMLLEPRRLLVRYAVTNPHAAYLLLTRSG